MDSNINNINPQGNNETFNQQTIVNSTLNNNTYQQSINQNNIPNLNENIPKKNKTKIIGIVIVCAVILLIGIIIIGGKSSSNNVGDTVGYGETLEVNEMDGFYDFDIKVLSVEKDYPLDNYFYSGDCFAIKVNVKNNSDSDLSLALLINFTLIDSSNKEVATSNTILNSMLGGGFEEEISSGNSESGYLYFINMDNAGYMSNIDDSDIKKLKISVPKELDKSDGVITGDYNDYYINLK